MYKLSKQQERYFNCLKIKIDDNIKKNNKQYNIFPWKGIAQLLKYHNNKDISITVNGTTFTIEELIDETNKTRIELLSRNKRKFYNQLLKSFLKNTQHISDDEIYNVYQDFDEQLELLFKEYEQKFLFCISSLKELNKSFKQNKKFIKESEEYRMYSKELRDIVLQLYEEESDYDYNDNDNISYSMMINEGANLDIRHELKQSRREYKKITKDIKRLIKLNQYDEAIAKTVELRKNLETAHKVVENSSSTTGSFVFSLFTSWTIHWLRNLALLLAGPFTFNVSVLISSIQTSIEQYRRPFRKMATTNKTLTLDDFNFYKNIADEEFNTMKNTIDKLEDVLKKEKQRYKKSVNKVTESTSLQSAKSVLYEACSEGKITVYEREELLKDLNDAFYLNEHVMDSNIMSDGNSRAEKFDMVSRVLYERCSNGELTITEREALLSKAYDMIFNESDDEGDEKASDEDMKKINDEIEESIDDYDFDFD